MREFLRSRLRSFGYAFTGWRYVLRTQRNTWIHAVLSIAVVLLSWWLGLSALEWAVMLITISMVWMAEFLNTALEAVVDLASPQQHPLAKVGKDVGAAAVLLSALAAVITGLLVLGPPLWRRLSQFLNP
jgi:diacylglycerol kinase